MTKLSGFNLSVEHQEILLREVQSGTFFGVPVELIGELYTWIVGPTEYPNAIRNLIQAYVPEPSCGLILTGSWNKLAGIPLKWLFYRLGISSVFTFKPFGHFSRKIKRHHSHQDEEVEQSGSYRQDIEYYSDGYSSELDDDCSKRQVQYHGPDYHEDWYCLVLVTRDRQNINAYSQRKKCRTNSFLYKGNTQRDGMYAPGDAKKGWFDTVYIAGESEVNGNQIYKMFPDIRKS